MEKINFNCFLQNIPISTKMSQSLMLMGKNESIIKQMDNTLLPKEIHRQHHLHKLCL